MQIVQITPGAGGMYCGNCLRDNALVAALRALGHQVLMVPLYLPLTLDEPDESAGTPVFYGGVNVYLEQRFPWFGRAPEWLHRLLRARPLLKWAADRAAKTQAASLGDVTLSTLRGELGNQARELATLVTWLRTQPKPDVICLSNALLVGLARRLKQELGAPVVCTLQGEDTFLDSLPESHRAACWLTLAERAAEIDGFIAPSRYFGELMGRRLALPDGRVSIVYNGISLEGYDSPGLASSAGRPPLIGYFARMCPEKGLDTLVEAYIRVRRRGRVPGVRLRVGGSCGSADESFVNQIRRRLEQESLLDQVEFHPNLPRARKVEFLQSLSVFSVPARYGEAFGLYLLEAWAAGVPVVQPRAASFPELIDVTGGGLLCAPNDPESLADGVETLLLQPDRAQALGQQARRAAQDRFTAEAMARNVIAVCDRVAAGNPRR